jgi:methyl-accepting chemotaxis protein
MSKLTTKIAVPIILAGAFAITIFIALDYDRLGPNFYIVLALLLVYVFFFGLATGQTLSSPIKKLLDKATELSKGNLSSRVYLETKDEFSELADTFNKIAEELEISHESQTNAEKSVGIKVKAKTKELEETIDALEQKVKNRTIELERLIEESNRLKEAAKSNGSEAAQLRQKLSDSQQKFGKAGTPKTEATSNENA